MKLYVLRERWGSLVESVRKPWEPTVAERAAVRQDIAAMPGWLQIPYGVGLPQYPTLKQFMEMACYYHMLHLFTWGLVSREAVGMTNAALAHWVNACHLSALAGVAFYFTVLPAVVMGVVWFFNPTRMSFICKPTLPWRYIFAYNEKLWWADFIGKDSDGKEYYVLCTDPGVYRASEQRGVWHMGGFVDVWKLFNSWVQSESAFMSYKEWRWDTAFVEYIGMLTYIGGGQWKLRGSVTDPWQEEAPPDYIHPPELRCKSWLEVP